MPAVEPADAVPAEPAPPEPINYEFTLPDGLRVDETAMTGVKDIFQEARIDPAVAQRLVDAYVADSQRQHAEVAAHWQQSFMDTRRGWVREAMADPEFGGAAFNTSKERAFRMIDLFVPQSDRESFDTFLNVTGAGDHPAFFRFINRLASKFDDGRPAPVAQPLQPSKKDRARSAMYDHPRSVAAAERNR